MADFLDILARDSQATCGGGYYQAVPTDPRPWRSRASLKDSIARGGRNAIITEIKRASPSKGTIRKEMDVMECASAMERGGAAGISVLTEPVHFGGSLRDLMLVRGSVSIPVLMKDIIVDRVQLDAASRLGADAALLIKAVFDRGYADCSLEDMIAHAHAWGMEVLLETHTGREFRDAVALDADIVGINNRDLRTLRVDLQTTVEILTGCGGGVSTVVSESGIGSQADVRLLRGAGAKAFLVGTSVMLAEDVEAKVRELAEA